MNDFRTALARELSDQGAPPLGDLVATATRDGLRVRRRRNLAALGGSAAALAAAVLVLLVGPLGPAQSARVAAGPAGTSAGPTPGTGPGPAPSGVPEPAPTSTVRGSDWPRVPPAMSGKRVPMTAPALLATVLDLLPRSVEHVGGFAAAAGNEPGVQLDLTSGRGTGMVRVLTYPGQAGAFSCRPAADTQCYTDGMGQPVRVSTVPGNCVENTEVAVAHQDGLLVTVLVGTCLAWDGATNPPGISALTVPQAIALAGDPSISAQVDGGLAASAERTFPHLPELH
ncbi:hypothetical protein [Kitasatospora paracochleata]|uniref:Neocarzinostatin family protein n=1 Tax=Kitasatospora paracochleata TaxID=58354 RepID=A0ABT1J1L2_9ACTN|nr:hypothetical protein [Kitasatospora paracochleata]MCP2310616.1 hypothetical protein [Kitasatospora paracochleata]